MTSTLPRVVIDLNSTDEDGETIVFLSDVTSGELQRGRMVTAYEPEDGVAAPAFVSSIFPDRGVAFLRVNWRAMRRDQPQSSTFRIDRSSWQSRTLEARNEVASFAPSTHATTSALSVRRSAGA